MEQFFTKTICWVPIFACFLLVAACTKTGPYWDIVEPLETEKTQEEARKSQEPLDTQETIKPQKIYEAAKPKIPPFVLLLSTSESEKYAQTRAAFSKFLTEYQPEAECMYHLADRGAELNASQFVSQKTNLPPDIVVSLDASAVEIAQTTFPETPGLAAVTLQENIVPHADNINAILLQIPMEAQLTWLKKFLPNVRRVGILYDPSLSSNLVEEAENAARENNVEIISYAVKSPKDLHAGLKEIYRNADVLLAIPDQTVYSGITAKEILLFSFRNRFPFVGLSESWVKAGALYALDIDYEDLGRQIAALTPKILKDDSQERKKAFKPEGVVYSMNLRSKDQLQLEIANDLIQGASKTFE
jgi:putative ABC transport system substrate-binding protein